MSPQVKAPRFVQESAEPAKSVADATAVRLASEGDQAHAPSPARQYQAMLESAWEKVPEQPRFGLGARLAIIIGGSAALWAPIGFVVYLALH